MKTCWFHKIQQFVCYRSRFDTCDKKALNNSTFYYEEVVDLNFLYILVQ